jgi:hypothetical protein
MRILDLPLKKEWYNMTESGEKPEEYREITPYWIERLTWHETGPDPNMISPERTFKPYTHVRFRYGYTKRTMLYRIVEMKVGFGNPKWGAPTDRKVFIIRHKKEKEA